MCVWCECVFGVSVCLCVCCGTLENVEKPGCGFENVSVCTFKYVPVYAGTTRTCVSTRARGAGTHGDVLDPHTEAFLNPHKEWSSPVLLTKKSSRRVITWPQRFTKETRGSYTLCLRKGREQQVPDSSNHMLYLAKLFSFRSLDGNFGENQQPDGSMTHSLSPPPLPCTPRPPQQHTTETETQRHRDRICASDTFHDVRLKWPLTFHNGFMFFFCDTCCNNKCIYICIKININIYLYVKVNRQGHHNIRNGILWAQTGQNTCTCTVSLHVVEL